ncbi:response regulator transcription factor [Paenibacillus mendelii]|uniref:Response regulator transcription factor n=1 Tax=Paenibacillus mendelii TaxID=206163 RepID=A0ABV6JLD0_9BACL|nr:response regulator transcription factor [Paenibacillus mendelii]MCQ6564033.1 response regulator transcription factor [Paenibacillus mendelii]
MRVLVVEDEARMRKALCNGLKKYGYAVDAAVDGEKALELVEINAYDAVVLDLNLPKIDGIEVLKGIRSMNRELRILILSARAAVEDKIIGLDTGANDYLAKPFHFKELDARIRSLLRRDFIQKDTILTYGDIKIDTALRSVTVRNHKIELTKKEYSILEYLFMHKDRIVGTEELIEHIWDENKADLFSNSFKVQLNSLKKKLAPYTGDKELIKNTRGFGYSLTKEYADETVQ